jgi:hypothetical protein
MQVEAVYDQGKLDFVTPLHFKRTPLRVVVNVPDEEIDYQASPYNLPPEVIDLARGMRKKLDAIRNAPLPPDDDPCDLTEKDRERLAAFVLREDC